MSLFHNHTRELTGKYFLKKRFFGGYSVIVEVVKTTFCSADFSISPEYTVNEEATREDLVKLNLSVL